MSNIKDQLTNKTQIQNLKKDERHKTQDKKTFRSCNLETRNSNNRNSVVIQLKNKLSF
jgi:hypothetical protein